MPSREALAHQHLVAARQQLQEAAASLAHAEACLLHTMEDHGEPAPQPVRVDTPEQARQAVGEAPSCPTHGAAFSKPSKFKNGGYYCTALDGSTPRGYCAWRSDRVGKQAG